MCVAVLVFAAANWRKRTGAGGFGVTDLALETRWLRVIGDDDDLGVLEGEVGLVEHSFH